MYDITEVSPTERTVAVTVDSETVQSKRNQIFNMVKQQARLPGFRPGKIPNKIIEKRFNKAIEEQLTEELVKENVNQFFKETKLQIIGSPNLSEVNYSPDSLLTFKIQLEIVPEFELAAYQKLVIEKDKVEVTAEEVSEQLNELQKRNAEYHNITSDRPVEKGDHVIIDFKGEVNLPEPKKSEMEKKMFGEAYPLNIGSNTFIPGFEEGLIGLKKNETKVVDITFPTEYQQSDLAGQKTEFTVTLKEIKVEKLLPIDDEFAKDFGDFGNLDELKQKIHENIYNYRESLVSSKAKRLLKEKLIDLNSGFPIPSVLVEDQINRFNRRQTMLEAPDNPNQDKLEEDKEKFRPMAEREARGILILGKIATLEKLEAEQAEINQKINELAQSLGQNPNELIPSLKEKGYIDVLAAEIREEKALNFVYEHAEVTEVEPIKETASI